ncbi:MAG: response regulator [Vicinamibacterales bacterium]
MPTLRGPSSGRPWRPPGDTIDWTRDESMLKVLLVEDEPLVRDMVRAFLERAGYGVEAVGTAEAVLGGWQDRAIDLLLTDVMLPGQTGVELAAALRKQRPGLKVVYMSGDVSDPAARESVISPGTRFLAKPFSRATLLGVIRSLASDEDDTAH